MNEIKINTMKKYLLLFFLFISCSKLEYSYDSYIDYSVYKKAYVSEISTNLQSITYNEEDMMNYFCEELSMKSAFNPIYNYYNYQSLFDSVSNSEYMDLRLFIIDSQLKFKPIDHDNGDVTYYYEYNITIECDAYYKGNPIYRVQKTGEAHDEYNSDNEDNYYEVSNTAIEEALKEIAKFFTKSYVI